MGSSAGIVFTQRLLFWFHIVPIMVKFGRALLPAKFHLDQFRDEGFVVNL